MNASQRVILELILEKSINFCGVKLSIKIGLISQRQRMIDLLAVVPLSKVCIYIVLLHRSDDDYTCQT